MHVQSYLKPTRSAKQMDLDHLVLPNKLVTKMMIC